MFTPPPLKLNSLNSSRQIFLNFLASALPGVGGMMKTPSFYLLYIFHCDSFLFIHPMTKFIDMTVLCQSHKLVMVFENQFYRLKTYGEFMAQKMVALMSIEHYSGPSPSLIQ